MSETALVRAILQRLDADKSLTAIRINSGTAKRGGRHIRLAPAGTSDLLVFVPCDIAVSSLSLDGTFCTHSVRRVLRVCSLEAKVGRNDATDIQRQWLDWVRAHGGHAAVVRSVDDAVREVELCKTLS